VLPHFHFFSVYLTVTIFVVVFFYSTNDFLHKLRRKSTTLLYNHMDKNIKNNIRKIAHLNERIFFCWRMKFSTYFIQLFQMHVVLIVSYHFCIFIYRNILILCRSLNWIDSLLLWASHWDSIYTIVHYCFVTQLIPTISNTINQKLWAQSNFWILIL